MHWFILVLYKTKNELWVVFPDYMFTYIDIVFCDYGLEIIHAEPVHATIAVYHLSSPISIYILQHANQSSWIKVQQRQRQRTVFVSCKDKTPKTYQSSVVYEFTGPGCNSRYIGKHGQTFGQCTIFRNIKQLFHTSLNLRQIWHNLSQFFF